jgi:hypothetical protein
MSARHFVGIAGAWLALAALTGCGSIGDAVEDQVSNQVENAVEDQIEKALESEDFDVDFGDGASLPDDFPTSVPVPDGTIVLGLGTPEGWAVTYELADMSAVDDVVEALESQGFTGGEELDQEGTLLRTFEGSEYDVALLVFTDSDVSVMQYTVARAAQ